MPAPLVVMPKHGAGEVARKQAGELLPDHERSRMVCLSGDKACVCPVHVVNGDRTCCITPMYTSSFPAAASAPISSGSVAGPVSSCPCAFSHVCSADCFFRLCSKLSKPPARVLRPTGAAQTRDWLQGLSRSASKIRMGRLCEETFRRGRAEFSIIWAVTRTAWLSRTIASSTSQTLR